MSVPIFLELVPFSTNGISEFGLIGTVNWKCNWKLVAERLEPRLFYEVEADLTQLGSELSQIRSDLTPVGSDLTQVGSDLTQVGFELSQCVW